MKSTTQPDSNNHKPPNHVSTK